MINSSAPLIAPAAKAFSADPETFERWVWTKWQIRDLIGTLSGRGCQVYLSMFSVYAENEHHHEWLSDHQEALGVWVGM